MTSAPKFQSFNWMRGVSDNHRISIIHRLILLRILIHRQKDGQCDPGYDAVADELGVHRTTVMRAVDIGVRFGWLAPPIRGRRTNASFVFTFPIANQEVAYGTTSRANQEVAPDELRSRSKRVKKSLKKVPYRAKSKVSTGHGHLTGKERKNGQKSQTLAPAIAARDSKRSPAKKTAAARPQPKSELGDSFREFWAIYPRRVAKEAAAKAFAAALEDGADVAALIEGAKRYAAARDGEPERYTAHASTWLRGKRWEDALPPSADGPVLDNATGEFVEVAKPRNRALTWDDCIAIVCGAAEDDEEVRHGHLH